MTEREAKAARDAKTPRDAKDRRDAAADRNAAAEPVGKRDRKSERKARRPSFLVFLWLVIMWQLLWGEVTWANVFGGIAVALAVTVLVPMPRVPLGDIHVNWPAMVVLFATFLVDFLKASFTVAWTAIRRADPPPCAIVDIPMRTDEDLTRASAIALINLQPGGIVIDIDATKHRLTMHLLDGSSTGRIDKAVDNLAKMERQVIKAFENRDVNTEPIGTLGHDHARVHETAGGTGTAGTAATDTDTATDANTTDANTTDRKEG